MPLSVRKRAFLIQYGGIAVFFLIGTFTYRSDFRLLPIAIAGLLASGFWLRALACPRCGKPIYLRSRQMFGVTWTYFSSTLPRRHCARCGFDLSVSCPSHRSILDHRRSRGLAGAELSAWIESWPIRKWVVFLSFVIFANAMGFLVIRARPPKSTPPRWVEMAGAAVSGLAVLTIVRLRCPRCGVRFGLQSFRDRCPHCHQDLRIRTKGKLSSHASRHLQ
jgi:hypothetical protein